MTLELIGTPFQYKMEHMVRLFYHNMKIDTVFTKSDVKEKISVEIQKRESDFLIICQVCLPDDGSTEGGVIRTNSAEKKNIWREESSLPLDTSQKEQEWECCRLLYQLLAKKTGITPPWGVLTGVRPVTLVDKLVREGNSLEKVQKIFQQEYLVSPRKTDLACQTYLVQQPFLTQMKSDTCSLYISIPFCPTRCSYCSFVSQSIEKTQHLMEPYVSLLCEEIATTGKLIQQLGFKLTSIYMGGGTPTTLSPLQMEKVLRAIQESFSMEHLQEYTVEAGRPDTITTDKLKVIADFGIERISINPQTLNQTVLDIIGRNHTVKQFLEAYDMARETGFSIINTDLIAGLPGESEEDFLVGLREIIGIQPENITVHTLSVKKSATLKERPEVLEENTLDLDTLLTATQTKLKEAGYHPYYLYRQKNMRQNQENVGFAKPKTESFYNIGMMEDKQTVFGVGAGATTKLLLPSDIIKRVYNYKYPYEYIHQFDEMQKKKEGILQYYERD